MSRIRSKDTTPEIVVRKLVHGMGFRYRLHVQGLPGRPDLVFKGSRKIIQVHGCFWHQHEGCTHARVPKSRSWYWRPKLLGNALRDKENEKELQKLGWEVLTLWDCELSDPLAVKVRVLSFLQLCREKGEKHRSASS